MGYQIEGRLLGVCACEASCSCLPDGRPDNKPCDSVVAYQIDRGAVNGVDVSGCTFAIVAHVPGHVLEGDWTVVAFIDERASAEQRDAILRAFSGQSGGTLTDIAQLIGDVIAVEQTPISFETDEGNGTLKIGTVINAEIAPCESADGDFAMSSSCIFSVIPGSPTCFASASHYDRRSEQFGLRDLSLRNRSAIQGAFRFET